MTVYLEHESEFVMEHCVVHLGAHMTRPSAHNEAQLR